MHSLERVRLLVFALRPSTGRLHGLAATAAMLTCVAVVLNVGPFAHNSNIDGLRGTTHGPSTSRIMEQPNGSSFIPRREVDAPTPPLYSQSAGEPENISEVFGALIRTSSRSVDPGTQLHPNHVSPDLMKRDAIVGIWAPDAGTCSARNFRDGVLPTVINTDGAWAGETFCIFAKKEKTETGWRVVAKCSNPREQWTSSVRLTVSENRLTWTSKRGTQAYTRCEPDVLMAEAKE